MNVVECSVPADSALGASIVRRADFRDAYRVPLRQPNLGMAEIFAGIFAHRPAWMTAALIVRNKLAALAGLEVPTTQEITQFKPRDYYAVGEKIGPWPIFFFSANELVAGRNNKHMDFRVSLMKVSDRSGPGVVLSTICTVHNTFGRVYLSSVIPVHKYGVRTLMTNAVAAQRI